MNDPFEDERLFKRLRLAALLCYLLVFAWGAFEVAKAFGGPAAAVDVVDDAPDSAFVMRGKVLLGTADFTGLARYTVADTSIDCLDGPGDRNKSSWQVDDSRLPERPINNSDYVHSEMAKGHTSPAGDHTESQRAMDAAHTLLIAYPQNQEMNAQIWERLEERRRRLARAGVKVRSTTVRVFMLAPTGHTKDGCELSSVCVTAQGKNQLWQPTHLATSVRCTDATHTWLENYLIPNSADVAGDDIQSFRVTCDRLEFLCNLNLWPCPPHLAGHARAAWIAEQEERESKP